MAKLCDNIFTSLTIKSQLHNYTNNSYITYTTSYNNYYKLKKCIDTYIKGMILKI